MYIFDMDSFVAGTGEFLDEEDSNDSSPDLDASITARPAITGSSFEEDMASYLRLFNYIKEFMEFLKVIEKLTNDRRRLDQNNLEERDKNEVLLEQNCKLKLENSTLENKIKRKSPEGAKEQREDMVHAASLGSEAAFTLTTTGVRKSEMTSNTSESVKQEAIEKIQVQWNTCLEEEGKNTSSTRYQAI